LRLVALLANPKNARQLDVESEQQNIRKALQGIANIYPEFYPNATIDVLLDALAQNAHIFHYSGHAKFAGEMGVAYGSLEGKGYLSLVGDDQAEIPFSAEKLALNLAGRGVRLAMLSASESSSAEQVNAWTGIAPALTRAGIAAVVGMQFTLLNANAINFCKRFYRALAAGQSIDEAVTDGRRAVFSLGDENERDWGAPVLYLRATDGVLFPKVEETSPAVLSDARASRRNAPALFAASDVKVDKRLLRTVMSQAFNLEELESLCAEVQQDLANAQINVQVNLEVVGGSSKTAQVLNLIEYLDRRDLLPYLEKSVRAARKGML
jgi:hypothetical protein